MIELSDALASTGADLVPLSLETRCCDAVLRCRVAMQDWCKGLRGFGRRCRMPSGSPNADTGDNLTRQEVAAGSNGVLGVR